MFPVHSLPSAIDIAFITIPNYFRFTTKHVSDILASYELKKVSATGDAHDLGDVKVN